MKEEKSFFFSFLIFNNTPSIWSHVRLFTRCVVRLSSLFFMSSHIMLLEENCELVQIPSCFMNEYGYMDEKYYVEILYIVHVFYGMSLWLYHTIHRSVLLQKRKLCNIFCWIPIWMIFFLFAKVVRSDIEPFLNPNKCVLYKV